MALGKKEKEEEGPFSSFRERVEDVEEEEENSSYVSREREKERERVKWEERGLSTRVSQSRLGFFNTCLLRTVEVFRID